MKHVVYHCVKAAQVLHGFPMFFLSAAISWKLKARRAAKGVQYRPRIFSFHVTTTRVGLRCALPSFRIPALRKHCGPCEAHYVPEGSAVFRHPHLLSILRFTLRNTSWQVSKLHWSAALRSSILRGSYKSGEDMLRPNR